MKKLKYKDVKEIVDLVDQVPMPTAYDIKRVVAAAYYCSTDEDFAEALGVEPIVFKIWRTKSPACYKAYQSWREHATQKVEKSLAKRAIGFTKRTQKQVLTRQGTIETLIEESYFPPSETAAALWLKNRAPEEWKDKTEVDVNVVANIRAWMVAAAGGQEALGPVEDAEFEVLPAPEPKAEVATIAAEPEKGVPPKKRDLFSDLG